MDIQRIKYNTTTVLLDAIIGGAFLGNNARNNRFIRDQFTSILYLTCGQNFSSQHKHTSYIAELTDSALVLSFIINKTNTPTWDTQIQKLRDVFYSHFVSDQFGIHLYGDASFNNESDYFEIVYTVNILQ